MCSSDLGIFLFPSHDKRSHTCVAATKFQYDYLNDDVKNDGSIDYSLSKKIPKELQQAIADANAKKKDAKKILVLINPPYGESGSSDTVSGAGRHKTEIAATQIAASMNGFGYASRELFAHFLVRIQREIPNAVIAMFSTLKYVNAPNFQDFRKKWSPKYLGGFIVHSKSFDGLKGNFPIAFLIWDTSKYGKQPDLIS